MTTIKIMIPCYGGYNPRSAICLLNLVNHLNSIQDLKYAVQMEVDTPSLPHARNKLVGGNLDQPVQKPSEEFTHFMFIGSDILYSPTDFINLLNADKPIISGTYFGKNPQRLPIAYRWDEEYFRQHKQMPTLKPEELDGTVKEVDFVGLGFCLIKRELFDQIEYPWFELEKVTVGEQTDLTYEDVAFCRKVKKLDHKICLHTGVKLGHLGTFVF